MVISIRVISISLLAISLPVSWLGYRTIFGLNNTSRNLQGTGGALAIYESQPIFPKTFMIEPVVDIPLPLFSIFLACARPNIQSSDLVCHFREHFRRQTIGKLILNGDNFQIKSYINRDADLYKNTEASITKDSLVGEDPRTFMWDGELYVMNNRAKHLSLIQVGDHGAKDEFLLPEFIGKKNIAPVPMEGNGIMFIDFQERRIHVCVRSTSEKLNVACEPFSKEVRWGFKARDNYDDGEWYYRGGTNGVELEPGVFVGFGHATKKSKDDGTEHDMFFWKLDTRAEKAHCFMDALAITHGLDHKITDPTSLLHVGGKWYIFTAESNEPWKGGLVRFTNRIYRINGARCGQFGHCGRFGKV